LFELKKVREISQPESDAASKHRSSLVPSARGSYQCSSSNEQKRGNQLGTQGIKAHIDNHRDQAFLHTLTEEESRTQARGA
jgi:hypothetical protein